MEEEYNYNEESIDAPIEDNTILEETEQINEVETNEEIDTSSNDSEEELETEPSFNQITDYEAQAKEEYEKQTDGKLKNDNGFTYTTFDKKTLIIVIGILVVLYALYIYFTYIM